MEIADTVAVERSSRADLDQFILGVCCFQKFGNNSKLGGSRHLGIHGAWEEQKREITTHELKARTRLAEFFCNLAPKFHRHVSCRGSCNHRELKVVFGNLDLNTSS